MRRTKQTVNMLKVIKGTESWSNINLSFLSDPLYGFCKVKSTSYILSYNTNLWSSYQKYFGEFFVLTLNISKGLDKVRHMSLISKLFFFSHLLALCSLIVDGSICPLSKNSNVPLESVLSPTFFLRVFNILLFSTNFSIHVYFYNYTLPLLSDLPYLLLFNRYHVLFQLLLLNLDMH